MGNSHFQFKQFRIEQGRSAMKVSTDACIQAAVLVSILKDNHHTKFKHLLDIGCGTNVLTLALMQELEIDQAVSVEIEAGSYADAMLNTMMSPWHDNIDVINTDIKQVEFSYSFDLIISNPPFFVDALKSVNAQRTMARHTDSLSLVDLGITIDRWLSADGIACILLPPREGDTFASWLPDGLHVILSVYVRPTADKVANRIILLLSRDKTYNLQCTESITIYKDNHQYSDTVKDILSPYYLHL